MSSSQQQQQQSQQQQQRAEYFLTCERSRIEKWLKQPEDARPEQSPSESFPNVPSSPQTLKMPSAAHTDTYTVLIPPLVPPAETNANVGMQQVKLVGFKAYIAEEWIFEDSFPCVIVEHTSNPEDIVCFLCFIFVEFCELLLFLFR